MNKIIFLDIDGVLNNARYCSVLHHLYGGNGYGGFDKFKLTTKTIKWDLYNVDLLKTLMDKTGAKIVISSTWRHTHSLNHFKTMFQAYGLKVGRLLDVTVDTRYNGIYDNSPRPGFRGDEVNMWLRDNDTDRYVILDDDGDFYPDQNLVQTDPEIGLCDYDIVKAIKILNG